MLNLNDWLAERSEILYWSTHHLYANEKTSCPVHRPPKRVSGIIGPIRGFVLGNLLVGDFTPVFFQSTHLRTITEENQILPCCQHIAKNETQRKLLTIAAM